MLLALSQSVAGTEPVFEPTIAIALEKDSFLSAEPIWVNIVVKNETAQEMPIHVIDPREEYLRFVLLSPEGEEVPYRGIVSDAALTTPVLAPGDSVSQEFDLLEAYVWPSPERKSPRLWTLRYLGAGVYTLKAYLQGLGVEHGGPGYGKTYSNTVTFRVVEPTGEEALAFEEYRRAAEAYWNTPGADRGAHLRLPYLEVADRYPASRYARMALLEAGRISARYGKRRESREDLRRSLEEYQLVIERYPGTREAEKAAALRRIASENLERLDSARDTCPEEGPEE
jgi:hypothetical protein